MLNGILGCLSGTMLDSQEKRENDQENSTLLKIATCIPLLGLFISQIEINSIDRKLKKLPLPIELRPDPMLGSTLDKNASLEEIKTACGRADQLESINRDYTKAALVNSLLTIALAVYALAINVIPFVAGAFLIGACSLAAVLVTVVLCIPIKHYETWMQRMERRQVAAL